MTQRRCKQWSTNTRKFQLDITSAYMTLFLVPLPLQWTSLFQSINTVISQDVFCGLFHLSFSLFSLKNLLSSYDINNHFCVDVSLM